MAVGQPGDAAYVSAAPWSRVRHASGGTSTVSESATGLDSCRVCQRVVSAGPKAPVLRSADPTLRIERGIPNEAPATLCARTPGLTARSLPSHPESPHRDRRPSDSITRVEPLGDLEPASTPHNRSTASETAARQRGIVHPGTPTPRMANAGLVAPAGSSTSGVATSATLGPYRWAAWARTSTSKP